MYGTNGRFLRNAFHRFFRDDLLVLLKRYWLETKLERGGRIFPVSDDAQDVVKVFERYMAEYRVQTRMGVRADRVIVKQGQITGVSTDKGIFKGNAVVLASGGASFPATGSNGDGYRIAEALGHTIVPLRPALVPIVLREIEMLKKMQEISLRNVRLTAWRCRAEDINPALTPSRDYGRGIVGKRPLPLVIESRMGEMMITHFGIGGPITLQMSLAIVDALESGPVSVSIDLKPALSYDKLRNRLQRDLDLNSKRSFFNIIKGLLPRKMIETFVDMSMISRDKTGNQITREERDRLVSLLKAVRFNVNGPLPLTSAMVTAGGVSLQEIDPRTMASRLIKGLYFCGEVMDIDADTGGFNLQAAFSTGYVAGESAAAPDS
jgi:hypothetical protein